MSWPTTDLIARILALTEPAKEGVLLSRSKANRILRAVRAEAEKASGLR